MRKAGLSQEGLKIVACLCMALDHVGAFLWPSVWLRVIGRAAFPVYCFLLVEGVSRTRDVKQYGLRIFLAALLAEAPFDLLCFGELTLQRQSVMVTLLLGLCMVAVMQRFERWGILAVVPFYCAAELLRGDYGGYGILVIALFAQGRRVPYGRLLEFIGLAAASWSGPRIMGVPIQFFAVLALIPIWLYNGEKRSRSRWMQWGFYLFYPVHMLLFWIVTLV